MCGVCFQASLPLRVILYLLPPHPISPHHPVPLRVILNLFQDLFLNSLHTKISLTLIQTRWQNWDFMAFGNLQKDIDFVGVVDF